MAVRGLATLSLLVALSGSVLSCATATPPRGPARAAADASEPGPPARAAELDGLLTALVHRQQQLKKLLADVERDLLVVLRGAPETSAQEPPAEHVAVQQAPAEAPAASALSDRALELLDRRLVITVALAQVEQAILRRRLELGVERPRASSGSPLPSAWRVAPRGGDPRAELGVLLQQAELALDEARRSRDAARPGLPGGPGVGRHGGAAGGKRGQAVVLDGRLNDAGGDLDGLLGGDHGLRGGLGVERRLDEKKKEGLKRDPARERDRVVLAEQGPRRPPREEAPVAGKGGFFGEGYAAAEDAPDDASRRASVVAHGAPPAGVMSAVRRHLGAMLECIPQATRGEGPVRFRVKARLGADGVLHEPVVNSGGLLPPDVVGCLSDLLARVRVPPAADGSSRVIAFPIWLSAAE